jgi:acyl carrier protein
MAGAPFFAELIGEKGNRGVSAAANFCEQLERTAPTQRLGMLEGHLLEQLGKVLRIDPSRMDKRTPFANLGIDSLMSLELRNRLEASLSIKLSAALLFSYSTTIALANHLLERLFPAAVPGDKVAIEAAENANDAASSEMETVPVEQEDESALVDKLGEFEEYLK